MVRIGGCHDAVCEGEVVDTGCHGPVNACCAGEVVGRSA